MLSDYDIQNLALEDRKIIHDDHSCHQNHKRTELPGTSDWEDMLVTLLKEVIHKSSSNIPKQKTVFSVPPTEISFYTVTWIPRPKILQYLATSKLLAEQLGEHISVFNKEEEARGYINEETETRKEVIEEVLKIIGVDESTGKGKSYLVTPSVPTVN